MKSVGSGISKVVAFAATTVQPVTVYPPPDNDTIDTMGQEVHMRCNGWAPNATGGCRRTLTLKSSQGFGYDGETGLLVLSQSWRLTHPWRMVTLGESIYPVCSDECETVLLRPPRAQA